MISKIWKNLRFGPYKITVLKQLCRECQEAEGPSMSAEIFSIENEP